MILGFGGYLVFGEFWSPAFPRQSQSFSRMPADHELGLIIGCAYDQITKIIPLFVIL